MDQQLTWAQHLDKVTSKMARALAALAKSRNFFTSDTLKTVAQTLVLSHMDYCACLLSAGSQSNLNKLQTLQNKAARLVLNAKYTSNTDDLHRKLNWPKVNERLYTRTLTMFHKILTAKKPEATYKRLHTIKNTHRHNTRLAQGGGFRLAKPKTCAATRTFLYRCIKSYNSFPQYIKASTQSMFKQHIKDRLKTQTQHKPLQQWW